MATVFGSCFGSCSNDNLRYLFSITPKEAIEEGMKRMQKLFRELA